MKPKSKAIIDFKDFIFFVVYQREGGYGFHEKQQLVKRATEDLKVEHIKGGRPHRTEWHPISRSCTSGLASVKYGAYLTWNGMKQLIDNACLYEYEHNTMGILDIFGVYPAVSLDSGYNVMYCSNVMENELKKRFGSNYEDAIYELQNYSHVNCYVSVMVEDSRLEEAIYAVFGKYYSELTEEQKKQVQPHIDRYNELCELMNDYIERLANCVDVRPETDLFKIDFNQLNFK